MELKVDKQRLAWIEIGSLARTGLTVEAMHDGEVGDYDVAALSERSVRDWARRTASGDHSGYEGIIVRLLEHRFESLTREDFTAENALVALDYPRELSGRHTPEKPWGGQCTAILPNGIPVDNSGFPRAVLRVLAGQDDGSEYLAKWRADVMRIRGMAIVEEPPDHIPKGRELTEILEMRRQRQLEQIKQDYPRGVPVYWWAVKVCRSARPQPGELTTVETFIIEAADEQDAANFAEVFLSEDWAIDTITEFESWLEGTRR